MIINNTKAAKFQAVQSGSQSSSPGGSQCQPLRSGAHAKEIEANNQQEAISCFGPSGVFLRVHNEYMDDDKNDWRSRADKNRYKDEAHWSVGKREKVKKVRFIICTLALLGLAFGLMSRLMMNVSIVEMVRKPQVVPAEDLNNTKEVEITTLTPSVDLIVDGEEAFTTTMSSKENATEPVKTSGNKTITKPEDEEIDFGDDEALHFNWTKQEQNMILGAFYIGYVPGIMVGGGIAQSYGSKWPLFICIFGSSIINSLTPLFARYNLYLLIASRVCLGAIQGSLFPSLYELFNKWLTPTESSIFAPLIKVSMPMGSLMGTLMPGLLASYGLDWPLLFYIGGGLCLAWSIVWLYAATSTPQTNHFVGKSELKRIMRKKHANYGLAVPRKSTTSMSERKDSRAEHQVASTPWLLIITNPSVLALTLVKFTYNMGMEFIYLESALYMSEAHDASIETISAITSAGYCLQMVLIAFVGWLAKDLVKKRALNMSVTKWRKTFQGGSNFMMAFCFILLALTYPRLDTAACLLLAICFFWMFGAGGESMVPYDLSAQYPASIVAFAHSISYTAGIAIPAVCNGVLGEETQEPARWSLLFQILAGVLALGGLVFCLVLKAKPFLPGEKRSQPAPEPNCATRISASNKSQQQQQPATTSFATTP